VAIRVRELPGKKFAGVVYQNAGSIDENTRTMLTEVRVPNKDNLLIPGMYAQVEFSPSANPTALRIPSNTLLIASAGPQVLVVGSDSKLKFVSVKIGRDFGSEVEIVSGLVGNEQLVTNPTDDLKQDQPVKIIASKETKKS
jgi:multidrug efflux pump subunit AcrA (membrane-fusion protein)